MWVQAKVSGSGARTTRRWPPRNNTQPPHHSPPPHTQNDNRFSGSQGLKRVFRARVWCSPRPPFTRSVEFPKVALLAHGTRTRP
eukprot:scaffold12211_cov38-Phaeocystis_antarctica.AAC.1